MTILSSCLPLITPRRRVPGYRPRHPPPPPDDPGSSSSTTQNPSTSSSSSTSAFSTPTSPTLSAGALFSQAAAFIAAMAERQRPVAVTRQRGPGIWTGECHHLDRARCRRHGFAELTHEATAHVAPPNPAGVNPAGGLAASGSRILSLGYRSSCRPWSAGSAGSAVRCGR